MEELNRDNNFINDFIILSNNNTEQNEKLLLIKYNNYTPSNYVKEILKDFELSEKILFKLLNNKTNLSDETFNNDMKLLFLKWENLKELNIKIQNDLIKYENFLIDKYHIKNSKNINFEKLYPTFFEKINNENFKLYLHSVLYKIIYNKKNNDINDIEWSKYFNNKLNINLDSDIFKINNILDSIKNTQNIINTNDKSLLTKLSSLNIMEQNIKILNEQMIKLQSTIKLYQELVNEKIESKIN